jgi:hypothetical protein
MNYTRTAEPPNKIFRDFPLFWGQFIRGGDGVRLCEPQQAWKLWAI